VICIQKQERRAVDFFIYQGPDGGAVSMQAVSMEYSASSAAIVFLGCTGAHQPAKTQAISGNSLLSRASRARLDTAEVITASR